MMIIVLLFHGGNRAVYWRLAEWLERWFGRKEIGGRIWKVDGELLGYKEGVVVTNPIPQEIIARSRES